MLYFCTLFLILVLIICSDALILNSLQFVGFRSLTSTNKPSAPDRRLHFTEPHATNEEQSTDYNKLKPFRDQVWVARRKMTDAFLSSLIDSQMKEAEQERQEATRGKGEGAQGAAGVTKEDRFNANSFASALTVVIIALVLRVGGRTALLQLVGIDLEHDQGLRAQIEGLLGYFQGLDSALQYGSLFALWFVCKLVCIDAFTIVLAISSGLLFGDLLQGTLVSVLCSSLSSILIFSASRYWLRPRVVGQIEARPLLRALDRSLQSNGFKTVLGLRLSPLLPIPIGGYNYLYGILSVKWSDFILGISLGSVKPYLLDCYLGIFSRSLLFIPSTSSSSLLSSALPSSASLAPPFEDLPSLLGLGAVVLASTLYLDVFQKTWEEIQREAQREGGGKGEVGGGGAGGVGGIGGWLKLLGIEEDIDFSPKVRKGKRELEEAWGRVKNVVKDEIAAIRRIKEETLEKEKAQEKIKGVSKKQVKYEDMETFRTFLPYESLSIPDAETKGSSVSDVASSVSKESLLDSLVFSFVLLETAFSLSNTNASSNKYQQP